MTAVATRRPRVLLVSCYELGHQPFAIASAWAQLATAGFDVVGHDASVERLPEALLRDADLVAISVPMHTALRLGVQIAKRARSANPRSHVCFFGLYAQLNAEHLLEQLGDSVIGGEFESALVGLVRALERGAVDDVEGVTLPGRPARSVLSRLAFEVPHREGLPALSRYAKLIGPSPGEERVVGYAETSRGCKHRCRHCPVTPVYEGRFFVIPKDVVLADVEQQIRAGARHVTFGDPDFFNGVGHSMAVAKALHDRHPEVTFDVTIKVEHLLKHRARLTELAALGCVFVISAFESLSDRVLRELDKGHGRDDLFETIELCRAAGLTVRPTFVAFTPWTSRDDFAALCDFVVEQGLVDHVDPIQLAIRLLVPPGSALVEGRKPTWLGDLDAASFGFTWVHEDPGVDALHREVGAIVQRAAASEQDPGETFDEIRRAAHAAAGRSAPPPRVDVRRGFAPRLTEPWFCCAEPSTEQLDGVSGCELTDAETG